MDTINKLQFRHCKDIILVPAEVGASGASETILDYIKTNWYNTSAWNDPVSPYRSLYGEPVVFKYKVEGEDDVQLALAIGIETNDETGSSSYIDYNKFLFINIKGIEDNIEAIWEEIEKLIKMISITAISSDTINLQSYSDENGTIISGDVNTVDYRIANNLPKFNNLSVYGKDAYGDGTGLFMYVDIAYDKNTEVLTFEVSDPREPNGIASKEFKLPNNYVTGGTYDIENEQIVLTMKEGDPVTIDCTELINEWDVEGESSKTPIVLNKKRVKGFDPIAHHAHSDILSADVRVDSERPYNILEKTSNDRYLYVRGHATNIAYEWNGESMTVNEALNDLKNIKISSDGSNILQDRADGFFANTTLDYVSSENKLVFRTTNVDKTIHTKEIKLNSVDVPIDEIYYDARTETLIIKWRNQKGEIQTIKIPIGDMIDEWEVLNPGHNVTLNKVRSVGGNDKLSADVNIYKKDDLAHNDNNILEDRDHSLYVKGTADNIKYDDTTVEGALDSLNQGVADETARAISAETALQKEIEAHVVNEDKSINVEKRDGEKGKKAVISVNLSEQDTERPNTIRLKSDGLYNFVDLDYDGDKNTLKLIKSANDSDILVEKEFKLETISDIISIEYNPDNEILTIKYRSGREEKKVEINLGELIEEWDVADTQTVWLHKERVTSGGSDILTASVRVCKDEHHLDNAIEIHQDGLYVHSYSGEIADLGSRIDIVSGDVITEAARAISAETYLQNQIDTERNDRIEADRVINEKITAFSADTTVKLNNLETNLTAKIDTVSGNIMTNLTLSADTLSDEIERERVRATSAETALRNDFVSGDTALDHKINSLETTLNSRIDVTENRLQAAIDSEKSRAEAADNLLDGKISTEKERAMTVEGELRNAITAETAAREAADDLLEDAIEAATYSFDDTNTIDFTVAADKKVTASVKIANADNNIIKLPASGATGVYASVEMKYDKLSNTLSFKTSADDTWNDYSLLGATVIDSIEYDSTERIITIKYTDGAGTQREVHIGVEDLFNDWDIANPSSGSAIELTKEIGAEGEKDKLYGKVLLTNLPDNAVQIVNNGLYVSNSAATVVECVSGKTDAMYTAMFGLPMPAGCGENIKYIPDTQNCVISGATSLYDADRFMAYQICEILEMWVSGMTCTTTSEWVDDGANKKMLVDVRASAGSGASMTDDDLYITDLTGKTIEHGVNEFTDTNALRIVCLEDGGGVLPDIAAKQNGIYLSNVWDCGKYYDRTNPTDMAGHDAVDADGYNANYWVDNDASAIDYSNYLRQ